MPDWWYLIVGGALLVVGALGWEDFCNYVDSETPRAPEEIEWWRIR